MSVAGAGREDETRSVCWKRHSLKLFELDFLLYGPHLLELDLRNNQLSTLPNEMVALRCLKRLNLSSNQFQDFPEVVCELRSLEFLSLCRNKIESLPPSVSRLVELRSFVLSGNKLKSLPPEIGDLKSLRTLVLGGVYGGNELKMLPTSIGSLSELEELDLSHNCLTCLPDVLRSLTNLVTLACFGNQLETVPESLCELKNLRVLNLGRNMLTEIPTSLGYMTSLELLSLFSNRIEFVPERILKMKATVLLAGNPLVEEDFCQTQHDRDTEFRLPSLKALAARTVVTSGLGFAENEIPMEVLEFLKRGHLCTHCNTPFFANECWKRLRIGPFLGHPNVPRVHYLCSVRCITSSNRQELQW